MWDGSPRIVLGGNSRERYTDQLRFEDAKLADMLDPVTIIPELWLEPLGRETHAGRGAIHVSGLPRKEMEHDISPAVMWLGADAYSLLVDADRGVLLRCTALLDGAAFAGMEVLSVAFDEALSEM